MPPLKKEKRTTAAAAAAAPVQPVAPEPDTDPVNSNYWQQYTEALQEIRDHPIFRSLTAEDPLDLDDRGVHQAYRHDACRKMLTKGKEYHCGCNLFLDRPQLLDPPRRALQPSQHGEGIGNFVFYSGTQLHCDSCAARQGIRCRNTQRGDSSL